VAGALEARRTAAESSQHNVRRLEQLRAFTQITAPIDGVVTIRNTDVGALIDPGASGGVARELFHVASTGRLRVSVNVPERFSKIARPGLAADLALAEFPGRRFPATLVRSSEAIDPASRTLLVEFEVDNGKGELLPGAYVQVQIKLPQAESTLVVPVTTLIFRSEGVRVAVVNAEGVVSMTPITLGRDFGTEVEVVSGLSPSARLVVSPPDSLGDRQRVRVLTNEKGEPRKDAGR
jgi:RND family efflux transporter MFP subunit